VEFTGEAAGSNANDASTFNNDLSETVVGALGTIARASSSPWSGTYATLDDGAATTGESFQRADASVTGIPASGGITFGCAIKPTDSTDKNHIFMGKYGSGAGFKLKHDPDCGSAIACVRLDVNSTQVVTTGDVVPLNEWHAVAGTSQAGGTDGTFIVVDGNAVGSTATVTAVQSNAAPLTIGDPDVSDLGFDFEGNVDDCWVLPYGTNEAAIMHLQMCGPRGTECACDSGTPANFKACTSNSDCGGTAICATDLASDRCAGHWVTGWNASLPNCNLNSAVFLPTTTTVSTCGDSSTTGDEECDDGGSNGNDMPCTANCLIATCGDALICSDASCISGPSAGPEDCEVDGDCGAGEECSGSCECVTSATTTTTLPGGACYGCVCQGCIR
jgi:hypothetical protein